MQEGPGQTLSCSKACVAVHNKTRDEALSHAKAASQDDKVSQDMHLLDVLTYLNYEAAY